MIRLIRRAAVAAIIFGVPSGASAQKSTLDPHYREALALEKSGNFLAALEKFSAIPAEKRLFATRLHIASCKAKLGRMHESEADLVDVLADPKLDKAQRETAEGQLTYVRDRMPKVAIKVAVALSDAVVTLDGEAIAPPVTKSVDPGIHPVIATKGGKEIYRREVQVDEGQSVTVDIDEPPTVATATARTPAPPETKASSAPVAPPPPVLTERRVPAVAYVLAGTGVALLGVSIASRLAATAANEDRRAQCLTQTTPVCDDVGVSAVHRWETVSFVTGGLAVLGIAGGVYLYASAPKFPSDQAVAGGAFVRIAPTVGGFQLVGAF